MFQAFQTLRRGIEDREIPLGGRVLSRERAEERARGFAEDSDVTATYVVKAGTREVVWHSRNR